MDSSCSQRSQQNQKHEIAKQNCSHSILPERNWVERGAVRGASRRGGRRLQCSNATVACPRRTIRHPASRLRWHAGVSVSSQLPPHPPIVSMCRGKDVMMCGNSCYNRPLDLSQCGERRADSTRNRCPSEPEFRMRRGGLTKCSTTSWVSFILGTIGGLWTPLS